MAKRSKGLEDGALQELIKIANNMTEATESKERCRKALQVGKELSMFLAFLHQTKIGMAKQKDVPKVWLAQILKDYPNELKKSIAYYDSLLRYNIQKNLVGFSVMGDCIEKGRLWVSVDWFSMDVPGESESSNRNDSEVQPQTEE